MGLTGQFEAGHLNVDTHHGSRGGGVIRIAASGTVLVDGEITCNGGDAMETGQFSGGGSGGSIWISSLTIDGTGNISATGGHGYWHLDADGQWTLCVTAGVC